VRLQLLIVFL